MHKQPIEATRYAKSIQGGKSLSELFSGLSAKQSKHVRNIARITMDIVAEQSEYLNQHDVNSDYTYMNLNAKSDDHFVELYNKFMEEHDFSYRLKNSGHKSKRRAIQKAKTKGINVDELGDLLRVMLMGSLEDLGAFINKTKEEQKVYHEEWEMRPSGMLVSYLRMGVDGNVGEVILGEKTQLLKANTISHELFEVIRSYKYYEATGSKKTLKNIVKGYKGIKKAFAAAANDDKPLFRKKVKYIKPVLEYMDKKGINFEFDEINVRSDEKVIKGALDNLNDLHSIIHRAYIKHADPEWQSFYKTKRREALLTTAFYPTS